MIPLKLRMRNFMCYKEVEPLDLSQVHVACLVGDNGHGKSAILDAITWALWGEARAKSVDELIHQGQTDMEVELDFLLEDNRYRIIRRREKGKPGRSTLEFQIEEDGRFRSLTSDTMRQTQAQITSLLRMDYETFINSAFLLQGRADEFTTKPPAERKRILGEILGLSFYDALEERAKERAKEREIEIREIGASLTEMDRELEKKPFYEGELEKAREKSQELSERLRQEEEELQRLKESKKELDHQASRVQELMQRIREEETKSAQTEVEVRRLEERLSAYQKFLMEGRAIKEGFASLLAAREANEEFNRRLSRLAQLSQERNDLEKRVTEAKNDLELSRRLAQERGSRLEEEAKKRPDLEGKLASLREELKGLATLEAECQREREKAQTIAGQVAGLKATNEGLKAEMELLREKLTLLQGAEARCPLCEQSLTEVELTHIEEKYHTQGQEMGTLYRQNKGKIEELQGHLREIQDRISLLERNLQRKAVLQGQQATLLEALEQAKEAEMTLLQEREGLAALEERLTKGDYALAERARLFQLVEEMEGLGYDPQEHESIREKVSALSHFERAKGELEAAREGMGTVEEALERARRDLAHWQKRQADDLKAKEEIEGEIKELEKVVKGLEEKGYLVQGLKEEEAEARQALGAAEQRLAHCRRLEEEKEAKTQRLMKVREEGAIYEELRQAFGKRGIQAMIIEAVLPELEEEANHLLNRMTEGRMQVRFQSQKITQEGKVAETLEIKISDELGARSYELYSGGEAFRINFAIRIALAKLLARRAGARLETLIIDEGFGTQDALGRERLVEAINSVQEDFPRILVITHIEELKDAFPVRIDIFKTPQGSQISMN